MQFNKRKIRIGLIGLGQMGRNHLRVLSLLKGVEIQFIYDLDYANSKEMAQVFDVPVIENVNGVWPSVDAAIICSPTSTHSLMLRIASKHVSNIFVEKPLSYSLESTRSDVEYIKKNNLSIQVGFIERFNPAVQKMKTILDQSERVINLDFTRTNKISARIKDVDVITDLMVHDIDLAIHLNGSVKTVKAQGIAENGLVALASAYLTHENGSFSRIHASRITERKMRKIEATCSDCFIDCDLLRKELLIHRQSKIETDLNEHYSISSIEQTVEVKQQEPLLTELQNFIALCQNKNKKVPNQIDALNAADICEKILNGIIN